VGSLLGLVPSWWLLDDRRGWPVCRENAVPWMVLLVQSRAARLSMAPAGAAVDLSETSPRAFAWH